MADVFYKSDVKRLLDKKHIVFFGDSNTRAMYKDLVWLLNNNSLIKQAALKKKQEASFSGDKLGKHSALNQAREYEEQRSYQKDGVKVDFFFITRCYNATLVDMMEDIHLGLKEAPDVIYINSTLWDVCRWGPNGVTEFKDNLQKLARLFKSSLPESTLVIWATALPVSPEVRSSLLIKQIDFLGHTLRFDVMEANQFARQVMVTHGFDVLDNHFHMRMQIHRRVPDGVHYLPIAIRLLTNLLLTHIALSWDSPLPNRVTTILLDKAKAQAASSKSSPPAPELESPKSISNRPKKQPSKDTSRKKKNGQNNNNSLISRKQQDRPRWVKSVRGRKGWNPPVDNQRVWESEPQPAMHNTPTNPNYPPVWSVYPPTFSESYFPDDWHFSTDPRFINETRFADNFHQSSNMSTRQRHMLNRSRYAPY